MSNNERNFTCLRHFTQPSLPGKDENGRQLSASDDSLAGIVASGDSAEALGSSSLNHRASSEPHL